jgi:hypothetical protein
MTRWRSDEPYGEASGEEDADDVDLDDGTWELDPNDPSHPDHDLSVAAGYGLWEPAPKPLLVRRGVVLLFSVLVIIGLMIPILLRFGI